MIVIGKIINTNHQGNEEEKVENEDDELAFEDVDINTRAKEVPQADCETKTFCEVQVEQLIAFSDLQFTIYSHIYWKCLLLNFKFANSGHI